MAKVIEEKVVGSMHIREIEAPPAAPPYVPPYVAPAPPVAPYVSPPAAPAVMPAAVRRVAPPITTKFLEDHKKIKKYIDTQGKKYLCPTTDEIVGETGLTAEDVRLHLDVMEEDEAAVPVQKGDNPAICSADGLGRLVENLRKLRT